MFLRSICCLFLLSLISLQLHAQDILGKTIKDATLILGTEYTRWQDGPVTKLRYASRKIDHPTFGEFRETDEYDFLNDVCEARHAFIPIGLEQAFMDDLNKKLGRGDHLWQDGNGIHISIREHGDDFELMVWTPVYETMLDNK